MTRLRVLALLALAIALAGIKIDESPDAWADPDLLVEYADTVDGCEWWASDFATSEILVTPIDLPAGVAPDRHVLDIGAFLDSGLEVLTHARCYVIDTRDATGTARIYSVEAEPLYRNFLAPRTAPAEPMLFP